MVFIFGSGRTWSEETKSSASNWDSGVLKGVGESKYSIEQCDISVIFILLKANWVSISMNAAYSVQLVVVSVAN